MNELQKMEAKEFVKNNGRIMRSLDMLATEYKKFDTIKSLFEDNGVDGSSFIESVNFLSLEGYIKLKPINASDNVQLSEFKDYRQLEMIMTGKGKRLMVGGIIDDLIEV